MTELTQKHIEEFVYRILCLVEPRSVSTSGQLRPGLKETPERVGKSFKEMFAGYWEDPKQHFKMFEEGKADQMVVVKDIEFFSMCEHHMLPFFGKAHFGYIPDKGRVIGLSKVVRVVECFSRQLQVQERLTAEIAECFMTNLAPIGCGLVMEANHLCMGCRGVKKPDASTLTCAVRGVFKSDSATRAEFLSFVRS